MKCIAIDSFGGRDKLQLKELPVPEIGPDEILIRVKAAGVNPVDWKIREGLLEGRLPHQFPIILGWDAAGVVKRIGKKVSRFKTGDAVMTYARKPVIQGGTYAEYVAVPENNAALKPQNLSLEKAAVLPLAGLTAYQALFDALQLKSGETILVHAGAGGVGSYAIQLAKNAGAIILTTARQNNHDYVKSLGADLAIDYTQQDFCETVRKEYPKGIDCVFDTIGGTTQEKSFGILKKGGRLVSILEISNQEKFETEGFRVSYVFVAPNAEQLEHLGKMAEKGSLKIFLAATYPLEEATRAHKQIETGHTRGKLALLC